MAHIHGQFVDGKTSQKHDVLILPSPSELTISSITGELLAKWPLKSIQIHQISEDLAHVHSHTLPDAMLYIDPRIAGTETWYRRRRNMLYTRDARLLVALAAALILCIVGLYFAMNPLAKLITNQVPVSVDAKIGEYALNKDFFKVKKDADVERIFDELVKKLTAHKKLDLPVQVNLLDMDIDNAFAIPGGKIFVGCKLIESAQTSEELGGILAHEIQHQISRHSMRQLVRSTVLIGGWQIAVGDYSGIAIVDPSTMMQIAMQKYSRADEDEADAGSIEMMRIANISPAGAAAFFKRALDRSVNLPAFLSTHPPSQGRYDRFMSNVVRGKKYLPVMKDADWTLLKEKCSKIEFPKIPKNAPKPKRA